MSYDIRLFAPRHMAQAHAILQALEELYAAPPAWLTYFDRVQLMRRGDDVYLAGADGQKVAVLRGGRLQKWCRCPDCGHEGVITDMGHTSYRSECSRWDEYLHHGEDGQAPGPESLEV